MRNCLFAFLCGVLFALAACEAAPAANVNPDISASDTAGELGAADSAADAAVDSGAETGTGADAIADTAADSLSDAVADTVADVVDAADTAAPDAPSDTGSCKWDLTDSSPATMPWTTFTVSKGAGPCPPDMVCSWSWTLDASGNIAKSMAGVASQAKMDAGEFGGLGNFLGNFIFLGQMNSGFVCPPPPTDIGISFTLKTADKDYSQNVTGCIFGSGCNDAKSVYELVTKY